MTDKPIAEKSATFERPLGSDPRDPAETRGDAREVASEDVLVERSDLGSESHVFVAKGDPIPAGLAPAPSSPAPSAKARRRKPPKV